MFIKFISYAPLLRKLLEEVLHNNKGETKKEEDTGSKKQGNQLKREAKDAPEYW